MAPAGDPDGAFYPLASDGWGEAEHAALAEVIASGRFTMGERVRAYEDAFAAHFGSRHAVMTSSGSAANLLALSALMYHPDLGLRPGDEILVPAVGWSTTYFPVSQNRLLLRFVDVDPATLNIDCAKLDSAITPRSRAVLAVNLLGNPVDADALRAICARHDLLLLEDNCESMGARLGAEHAGRFGLFGTFSTFFSHHISTMEGGMVLTDDRKLADTMLAMRAHGWTRDLPPDTHLPVDPDPFLRRFRFVLPGYNLRPLEMEAALGLVQLARLDGFVTARRANAAMFQRLFADCPDARIQTETGRSSWFGFALTLQGRLRGRRTELVHALDAAGIESRPVVTGNFLKNPVIRFLDHSVGSTTEAADRIDRDGLFVGNHPRPLDAQLARLREIVQSVANRI